MANTKPSDTFLGITSENDMVFLGETSGTAASTVDLEPAGMDATTYGQYYVTGVFNVNTAVASPRWRVATGATPTYITSSNYNGTGISMYSGGPAYPNYTSQAQMTLDGGQGLYVNVNAFFQLWFQWNSNTDLLQFQQSLEYYRHTGALYACTKISGACSASELTAEVTGFRLFADTGTLDVDHMRMYGIKKV